MQKVLVTGAAGFVGGWVAESFDLAGIPVRAGVRRWSSASRLVRRKLEVAPCDVTSVPQLRAAMADCDAVIHCAVGNEEVTVRGTENVLAVAHEMRLERIVHLSSVAVYGEPTGIVPEDHPRNGSSSAYALHKISAENICEKYMQLGAPVVILRPTIVYGPFGYTWTVSFAHRLFSGKWGTFGKHGDGTCNLVYVTDVVQAAARALTSDRAVGATFNINGGDIVTWNEYFRRFNAALGQPPLKEQAIWPIAAKSRLMAPIRAAGRFGLSHCKDWLMSLNAKSALAAQYMRATESSLKVTPTAGQLRLFGRKVDYPNYHAKELLGYQPLVGVSQGVQTAAAWVRQKHLLF
ncbi:MAG: NAD(P)-dependent oxidoreductase [Planctomycetales bacterium]|nr:NAD(P)-dependent oxidoreductase [Planctomycetales bacterium]